MVTSHHCRLQTAIRVHATRQASGSLFLSLFTGANLDFVYSHVTYTALRKSRITSPSTNKVCEFTSRAREISAMTKFIEQCWRRDSFSIHDSEAHNNSFRDYNSFLLSSTGRGATLFGASPFRGCTSFTRSPITNMYTSSSHRNGPGSAT